MLPISGYQIFAELKHGPVTKIYKAFDTKQQQVVLIKMLQPEVAAEPRWRTQLLQEGRLSAKVSHPNLRRVLDSGLVSGTPYLVLEYVDGPTLHELIHDQKKLPLDLCLFIAKEIAKAISAVHQKGLIHRDIKPQNIFLSPAGEVKLGDLGMAHDLKETSEVIAGTPAYMSPEQVLGKELTAASDLFAFGAVLYEMLTGEPAFASPNVTTTLHHIANWEPAAITSIRSQVPAEMIALVQTLLAKTPSQRFHDADEVFQVMVAIEHAYGITTTGKNLAEFFEAPAAYRRVMLVTTKPAADADPRAPRQQPSTDMSRSRINYGKHIFFNAAMFLAGVMFVRGVKEYREWRGEHILVTRNAMPIAAQLYEGIYDITPPVSNLPSFREMVTRSDPNEQSLNSGASEKVRGSKIPGKTKPFSERDGSENTIIKSDQIPKGQKSRSQQK